MLIELALLAVLYYYAFGDHEITPSSAPAAVRAFLSLSEGRSPSLRATTSGVRAVETLVYSFSSYMRDVFSVQDVLVPGYFSAGIGGTAGEGEGEHGLLSEPLNSFCIGSGSGDADEDTGGGGGAVPGNGGRAGTGARAGAGAGGVTNALHSGAAKHAGFLEVITSPVRNNAGFWSPDRSSNNRNNKNGPAGTSQQKQQYSPVPATSTAAAGQEEQGGSLSPFVNMSDIYGQQEQGDRSLSFRSPSSSAAAVGKGPADTNAKTGTSTGAGPNSPYVDFTAVYGDPSDQNGTFSV